MPQKTIIGIVLALVLCLAGLNAFFFIAGRDIDPPDVSDVLPPPVPPITEAENMVPVLTAATNRLALVSGPDLYFANSCYRNPDWDRRLRNIGEGSRVLTAEEATAWADRILETNAALFAALDAAAKRPRAQYPNDWALVSPRVWHGGDDPLFWQVWQFETEAFVYGQLVALRARRLRERGQAEAAVQELLRYGEMFDTLSYRLENGSLVLTLRSPVIPVVDELVRAAVDGELSAEACARIDAAFRRWMGDYVIACRRQTRYCVVRTQNLDLTKDFGLWRYPFAGYVRYLFQRNRTVWAMADIIRAIEAHAYSLPYTAETRTFFQSLGEAHMKTSSGLDRWIRRNGLGTSAVDGYADWHKSGGMIGQCAFWFESDRVVIAAARYRRKHGCYPPTLDALVPEFLAAVPCDPFDASKPIGYDAEQGTLHTVGADGTFNGKVRDPRLRYCGLAGPDYRYIRRIDGRSMEKPLKLEERKGRK